MHGFRKNSPLYDLRIETLARSVVSREARGFLLAGFFGGLSGGLVGGIIAFGLGSFLS